MNTNENGFELNQSEDSPQNAENNIWYRILWNGLGETFIKVGSIAVTVILCGVVLVFASRHYLIQPQEVEREIIYSQEPEVVSDIYLPYYSPVIPNDEKSHMYDGVYRISDSHTNARMKARSEVIQYTVQPNDTIIGISEQFNLQPSTIFFANTYKLYDDPHALMAGMVINILPVDGVYYEWHDGDGLNGVANYYSSTPEAIIDFPGNGLSPETIGDYSNPNIKGGTWLVIPGGKRAYMSVTASGGRRENGLDGPIGSSTFVWPTSVTTISGYEYDEATNHRAIDIGGSMGNPVYAADSGVVTYAGFNEFGYGNLVIIDHGNGFETYYAHLNSYNVGEGYYVIQGELIGEVGTTGNSSGPHLHYEIRYNGVPVNPHNYYP